MTKLSHLRRAFVTHFVHRSSRTYNDTGGPDAGATIFMGVHNLGGQTWLDTLDECVWMFTGVVDDCGPQGG